MSTLEVKVPAIGDFTDVPVIELFVKPGDQVKAEDPLVTLESDKATMDVPAPTAGTVKDVKVKLGDKVSEGVIVLVLDTANGAGAAAPAARVPAAAAPSPAAAPSAKSAQPASAPAAPAPASGSAAIDVKGPDIGDFKDVPVIEVFVKAGDLVKAEDPLVTLESDKATMDVPSPAAGTVKALKVKVGDKVSEGSLIAVLDSMGGAAAAAPAPAPSAPHQPRRLQRRRRRRPLRRSIRRRSRPRMPRPRSASSRASSASICRR